MRHRNRSRNDRGRQAAEALFEEALLGMDDGGRRSWDSRTDRKTLQLCRQVERALGLAISGECGDELLRAVSVVAVKPIGSGSQLLVVVVMPAALPASHLDVLDRLNQRKGRLRAAVAASICRKRTPSLSFVVIPATPQGEGGGHDED